MYQEINQLVDRALDKDQEAIIDLIQSLTPMILSRIRRIHPYTPSREDLVQEAHVLLLDCLESYSRDKKVPFVHYYHMQLQYLLWDLAKKESKAALCLLDQPDPTGQAPVDQLESDTNIEEDLFQEEAHKELRDLVASLPQREAQVIQLHFFAQLGLSEISGYLNLSYQTVANTKTRALKKLRRTYDSKQKTHPL